MVLNELNKKHIVKYVSLRYVIIDMLLRASPFLEQSSLHLTLNIFVSKYKANICY